MFLQIRKNYFFLNQLKIKNNKKNTNDNIVKILVKSFFSFQTHLEMIFFSKLFKYFSIFCKSFSFFAYKYFHDKLLEIFFKFFSFNLVKTYSHLYF